VTKLLAFLKRDFQIEASYRVGLVTQLVWVGLSACSYYFLARFVGSALLPGALTAYGGDYFAFILVGVALDTFHTTFLDAFSRSVRDAQLAGTLETLLTTQTSLSKIVVFSAAYRFVVAFLVVLLYLGVGWSSSAAQDRGVNWLLAAVVLFLAVLVFASLGILSASYVIFFKRGSPVPLLLGGLSWLIGGILYPISVLPAPLRTMSSLLPMTHAVEGLRSALLRNAGWGEAWPSVGPLLLFAALLLPASLASFEFATRRARVDGTLGHY
jgi:ABC-2 type transport system permease protein